MKGITVAASLGASLLSATVTAQVVQWDFEKQQHDGRRVSRRASSVDATVANEAQDGGYFASVTIGTPGQKLSLQLDTGSSDIWVPYVEAQACEPSYRQNTEGCTRGSCK
jgi:elongation factor G